MRKSIVVAAALLMVGASPATAGGTAYKVQIGSLAASAGPQTITGSSAQPVQWRVGQATLSCQRATILSSPSSTVTNSPTQNVLDLIRLTGLSFGTCQLNGFALTVTQLGPIAFHGVSGATTSATDTVSGHLDSFGYSFRDVNSGGAVCRFTVAGQAAASYRENTRALAIDETGASGGLVVKDAAGCGQLFTNGQTSSLTTTLTTRAGSAGYTINIKP